MSRLPFRSVIFLGLFVSAPAWAYIWFGNPPAVTLRVDRPAHDITAAVGTLDAVRMHACGGGHTDFAVDEEVDLASPFTVTVSAGAWCGVSALWGSPVVVTNGSWTVEYSELHTSAEVDQNPDSTSVAMTPLDVISGSYSGVAPRLHVGISE